MASDHPWQLPEPIRRDLEEPEPEPGTEPVNLDDAPDAPDWLRQLAERIGVS